MDLGTGQFVMEKMDLALADVIPLALARTYRAGDNANRPFGIGRPEHHANPEVGKPHYHPTYTNGKIIENGVHHTYPGR